jgi:hypothetical protein
MGPTHPIQWVPWSLSPRIKWPVRKADNFNLVSMSKMEVYFHSPIRLHGVMLNELRTRTSFIFYLTRIAYFTSLSLKLVSGQRPNTQRCSAASPWTDLDCAKLSRALIITMKCICRSRQACSYEDGLGHAIVILVIYLRILSIVHGGSYLTFVTRNDSINWEFHLSTFDLSNYLETFCRRFIFYVGFHFYTYRSIRIAAWHSTT